MTTRPSSRKVLSMQKTAKHDAMHTVATLAADNDVAVHCVEYVLKKLSISPSRKVGNANVYGTRAARTVAAELSRILHKKFKP